MPASVPSAAAAAPRPIPPRTGWASPELLPANLPAPAALGESNGANFNHYVARAAYANEPGPRGVYMDDDSRPAGKDLFAAVAAARDAATAATKLPPPPAGSAMDNEVARAVTVGKDGTYYVTPVYGWSGNPENENTTTVLVGDRSAAGNPEQFKFVDSDLIAIVDPTSWVQAPGTPVAE
jgi:hypothetical protein